MTFRTALALSLALVLPACGGGDDDKAGDDDELSGTTGTVDGTLDYGGEPITFASGIAFGDSFFHDEHDVIVLTAWGDASCDSKDSYDWEGFDTGYKLDIPHDNGTTVDDNTLWDCAADPDGYGGCGGADYPVVVLDLDTYERERGGKVSGTITVGNATDDFLSGVLDIELTYCGDW